ncbi:hypothetical protein MAR_024485 [Mya arenaria]|uniref:DUF4537 domain-containing protein n=1 Tax=Mya arenaria TaxID=6604 RepID=A0ABY7DTX1_MYAAR|nr:hypothetical protein MAR_024485 [Mya arenaria]
MHVTIKDERQRSKEKEKKRHVTKKDESLERKPEKEKHCCTTKIEKEIQTIGDRIDQNGDKIGQEIQTSRIQISEHLIALERQMEKKTEHNEVNVQILDAKINTVGMEVRKEVHVTGEKIVTEIKALGKKCCGKKTTIPPPPTPPTPPPPPSPPPTDGPQVRDVVLGKWADDCWYYFGRVVSRENESFWVKDSLGHEEKMDRNSILTEEDRRRSIKNNDYVIAPLPRYIESFGPGKIINGGSEIEFFNGEIADVRWDTTYKITKRRYERDVKDIKKREEDIQDKKVLVLNKNAGRFILTTIENPLGKEYFKTAEGREEPGEIILPQKQKWKYVAAPIKDGDETYYLPARVNWPKNNGKPIITYCNGTRERTVAISDCHYLYERLYNLGIKLYKRNK